MSKTTYYQKNRNVLLNKSKEYYKNNRELIRERANNISCCQKMKKK